MLIRFIVLKSDGKISLIVKDLYNIYMLLYLNFILFLNYPYLLALLLLAYFFLNSTFELLLLIHFSLHKKSIF